MKKSAGRPPKVLNRKKEERKGFLKESQGNIFELIHNNPDMFQYILEASRKSGNERTFMSIYKSNLVFYFESNGGNMFAVVDIMGERMVGYYGLERHYSCLNSEIIGFIKKRKKGFEKITLIISEDKPYDLKIILSPKDESNIYQEWYSTLLDGREYDISKYNKIYSSRIDYPLAFKMEWSSFKEYTNGWKEYTTGPIAFEKDNNTPLRIGMIDQRKGDIVLSGSEFNIRYKGQGLFASPVPIMLLHTIAASDSLSPYLEFFVTEKEGVIFVGKIDELAQEKKMPIENTESATIKYFYFHPTETMY